MPPKHYVIPFTAKPPVIDGDIDEDVWKDAPWTDEFRDIEGTAKNNPIPYFKTRAKMLWDKNYLYIAGNLEEKHIWAYVMNRDEVIFQDNDFEVFIDPRGHSHNYFEFEMNARNVMWDLFLIKPYRDPHMTYYTSWDSTGLKHAVKLFGTLNDPKDEDERWTVEIAIPFRDLSENPKANDIWRLGFSRVEWQTEIKDGKYVRKNDANGRRIPEYNWVWNPTGEIAMHCPERWGYILFSPAQANEKQPEFKLPDEERLKAQLWYLYYKQRQYRGKNGAYAKTLQELDLSPVRQSGSEKCTLTLEAATHQFRATATGFGKTAVIEHDGFIYIAR
ncbi:hypothetical protein FACS189419_06560 [Planctomycetales bacterium]|nr:hypothetical protein FACS189419_06560 [Planctomycetales bacterium]